MATESLRLAVNATLTLIVFSEQVIVSTHHLCERLSDELVAVAAGRGLAALVASLCDLIIFTTLAVLAGSIFAVLSSGTLASAVLASAIFASAIFASAVLGGSVFRSLSFILGCLLFVTGRLFLVIS